MDFGTGVTVWYFVVFLLVFGTILTVVFVVFPGCWNCPDSVVFCYFSIRTVLTVWYYVLTTQNKQDTKTRQTKHNTKTLTTQDTQDTKRRQTKHNTETLATQDTPNTERRQTKHNTETLATQDTQDT
jgi:membrane protein implicated in regulation of membrane protease activity